MRQGVTVTVRSARRHDGDDCARPIWSAATAAPAPVRKQLGIPLRGEGNLLELRQALYRCDELFDRIPIGNGPGKGRHYHVADDRATLPDHAGLDQALYAARDRRQRRRHEARSSSRSSASRSNTRCCPAIRGGRTCCWPTVIGDGRIFLAGDAVHLVIPTGGLGMNTGVGDAHRPVVEARRHPAGLGRRQPARIPTRSSAARSATAMSAPRATPRSAGASGAR